MPHDAIARFLGLLVLVLGAARLCGALARRVGQPAVLGELIAGVVIGTSALGWVNPSDHRDHVQTALHLLAEVGVVLLLFQIGLETDLGQLVRVGGASAAVALVGVALPFALGYGVCRLLGLDELVAVVAGASLTATSVGITARVLADLGRLHEPESRIILGAAVLDDIIGLVILTVVSGLAHGAGVSIGGIARATAVAFGFLAATLVLGRFAVPFLIGRVAGANRPGALTLAAVLLAFGLAWLAERAGSARIIGAFAAGLLLARTAQAKDIERGIAPLGHFFVPLFFVSVGAAVDLGALNPLAPGGGRALGVGALLTVAAVAGKLAAGYAPFWFRGDKRVVGVGMVPRGEVGLIFAQTGLAARRPDGGDVLDPGLFSAITLMVMATTFVVPPLLKLLFPPKGRAGGPLAEA